MPIASNELLARFIVRNSAIRSDSTVKPDAFMPHPGLDLSVVRHIGLDEPGIWQEGQVVAAMRRLPLRGRADFLASVPRSLGLEVAEASAPPRNHALVTGWPAEKSLQKIWAMKIAAESRFYGVS